MKIIKTPIAQCVSLMPNCFNHHLNADKHVLYNCSQQYAAVWQDWTELLIRLFQRKTVQMLKTEECTLTPLRVHLKMISNFSFGQECHKCYILHIHAFLSSLNNFFSDNQQHTVIQHIEFNIRQAQGTFRMGNVVYCGSHAFLFLSLYSITLYQSNNNIIGSSKMVFKFPIEIDMCSLFDDLMKNNIC